MKNKDTREPTTILCQFHSRERDKKRGWGLTDTGTQIPRRKREKEKEPTTMRTHNEPTEERDRLRDREHNSLVGDSLRYNKF